MKPSPHTPQDAPDERVLREALSAAVVSGDSRVLWEHLGHHLEAAGAMLSPHTLRSYRTGLSQYMQFLVQTGQDCSSLPPLQTYVEWLQEAGVKAATVRTRLAAVKVLLTALEQPPAGRVALESTSCPEREGTAYTEAEVAALVRHALPEERVLLQLVLEGGLTTGEVSRLRRTDLHLDGTPPYLVVTSTREKTSRVVLTPLLWEELRGWLRATPQLIHTLLSGTTQPYLDYRIKALCERAGVSPKGLRGLRVTAGARLFRETGQADAVRQFLRLSDRAKVEAYCTAAAHLDDGYQPRKEV